LFVPVAEVEVTLDDDPDASTDDGATVGVSESGASEEVAPPAVRVNGVVGSLAAVGASGDVGEPESSPRNTRIKAMARTPAIPIPFCRSRTVKT
jgi:hypothetical protein